MIGESMMSGPAASLEHEIRAVVTLGALEPLADALPHGVLVIGSDGTIRLTNRLLETQFGYERGELIGQSVERLLPDTLSELVGQHGRAVLALVGAPANGADSDFLGRRRDGGNASRPKSTLVRDLRVYKAPIEPWGMHLHSITRSARCRTDRGIVTPRARAVF